MKFKTDNAIPGVVAGLFAGIVFTVLYYEVNMAWGGITRSNHNDEIEDLRKFERSDADRRVEIQGAHYRRTIDSLNQKVEDLSKPHLEYKSATRGIIDSAVAAERICANKLEKSATALGRCENLLDLYRRIQDE